MLKEVGELFSPAVYLVHSFYQAVVIKLYLVLDPRNKHYM